jgi:hypothetical protein
VLVPANKPPLSLPRMHLKLRLVLYGYPGKVFISPVLFLYRSLFSLSF